MSKKILVVLLALGIACIAQAATVYVNAAATAGTNNGSSWANGYLQIASALPGAGSDVIKVAAGTYKVSTTDFNAQLNPNSNVTIQGGYVFVPATASAPAYELRDPLANQSIISADINGDDAPIADLFVDPLALENACLSGSHQDNGNYIFILTGKTGITLDGLVLKGVFGRAATTGSALRIEGACSNITVKNCRFVENYSTGNQRGSALFIYDHSTNIVIQDCVFFANSNTAEECFARVQDSAAALGTTVTVRGCVFTGNSSTTGGASGFSVGDPGWVTVDMYDCAITRNGNGSGIVHRGYDNATVAHPCALNVYNTVISGNSNTTAGAAGVRIHGSSSDDPGLEVAKLQNCLITDNASVTDGAGVRVFRDATDTFINCTIANNVGPAEFGEGFVALMAGTGKPGPIITQRNCIIWGNSQCDNHLVVPAQVPVATVTYCCIDNSDADPNNYITGTGNITTNPQFADAAFHVSAASLTVNAGDPADDWSKEPKCNGERIDMGAWGNTAQATPTVAAPVKALYGDVNCDDIVNLADFSKMASEWLQ
jgi:hypothetical protein